VASELKKMTMFIRQEAFEKAREIEIKADEEFAIEKSKLVRQETSSIDAQYEKKFKQASMSQQITRSTLANKTRLRVLSARQELLDDLFEKARKQLSGTSKDKSQYQELCTNLILEALYVLNESKIQVRARKQDTDLIKKAAEAAAKKYKETMSRDTNVTLDEKNPLPDSS
jgi:V-type H+-transporting ATPase subunit E